ncbi:MAG: hypothetical protein ACRCX7_11525 [Cetobacterium sp.]|uniref:hypothetical protein n=1 Tax=Cetobacterium sp. TaxID=2071632 RepID=UPI003F31CD93
MKNYKQLILTTAIMLGVASATLYITNENTKATISKEIEKFHINQELKSIYSEYNLLIKNQMHGAKIPQSRLDKLQIRAKELRERHYSL